jgi:hypothetical protein
MGLLRRRAADALPADRDGVIAEIGRLTAANRAQRDRDAERRLVRLRHAAGVGLLGAGGAAPRYAEPEAGALGPPGALPAIAAAEVTPGLLRAGILRDGCLLVRGLVERDAALALAAGIDAAFAARAGGRAGDGLYDEFEPADGYDVANVRPWIEEGGGVLAVDSPRLLFDMLELFGAAGVPGLVTGYLGEPPLLSAHKTTLRKAEPQIGGAWHQDGAFMGDVRALNLWLSLSRCGDIAPGLDIVPRRLERIVVGHREIVDVAATRSRVETEMGAATIERPIFEPGDALFFDEMFLHQTGSDPSMPEPRFAVESWFFGASAFPADYAPVAL